MSMTADRARITPVDVVFAVVSLAVLVFLYEPAMQLLDSSSLGTGTELLFRMTLPGLVATLSYAVYRTSLLGDGGGA